MNPFVGNPEMSNEHTGLSLKVIGVGTAGCNIADHLQQSGLPGAEFVAVNTDAQALARTAIEHRILVGESTTGGLGTASDPERGRQAVREDADAIGELCRDTDLVFVVTGLGGGTGTGAAPIIAAKAKESKALVVGFATLPFALEGKRKETQAAEGLSALQKSADGVICLPNQKVFELIDENTSLVDTFETTNEYVAQGVRAIWKLVGLPGRLNVDFGDLRTLIHGRQANSSFATVEAGGSQRVRDAVDALVKHPLLEKGGALAEAEAVLVSICGPESLSMAELQRLTDQLNRHCENADVRLGAIIDDAMGDQISVTLVAARSHEEPTPSEPSRLDGAGDNGVPLSALTGTPGSREGDPATEAEPLNAIPSPVGKSWKPRGGRKGSRASHPQLPLDMIPKGRFDKSEPTLYKGEDLDVPTFVRRNLVLNMS